MMISRTPYRISFFGGGTDYPDWYRTHGGAVLSTTINKFSYITCRNLPPFHDYKYLIRYFKREEVRARDQIEHPSVRKCLEHLGIDHGLDIVHHGDLPARSGLGSSSTFTVGMLHALYALKGQMVTKRKLADEALYVEQQLIGEAVGSQDQIAASFGGFNRIDFGGPSEYSVTPISVAKERTIELQNNLMLFFSGLPRIAATIAKEKIAGLNSKQAELRSMHDLLEEAQQILVSDHASIDEFGKLLNKQWELKKSLAKGVTTTEIDSMYDKAMAAGALGGKLLGAGGGGFILFYVPPSQQHRVKESLKNYLQIPFNFDNTGSQIIYFSYD